MGPVVSYALPVQMFLLHLGRNKQLVIRYSGSWILTTLQFHVDRTLNKVLISKRNFLSEIFIPAPDLTYIAPPLLHSILGDTDTKKHFRHCNDISSNFRVV